MRDSRIGRNSGPGNANPKEFQKFAQNWGKLPEKERAKAMQDMTRGMPPKYKEVIENYFKKVAQTPSQP